MPASRQIIISARNKILSSRKYQHHHDHCLFYANGKYRKCIVRCPAGAISDTGHDKDACKKYLFEIAAEYAKSHYGFMSYGCGFYQTAVPCEAGIPRGLPSEKHDRIIYEITSSSNTS